MPRQDKECGRLWTCCDRNRTGRSTNWQARAGVPRSRSEPPDRHESAPSEHVKVAAYARVSSDQQEKEALTQAAQQRGYHVWPEYLKATHLVLTSRS
jgi:predicted site-specific integrase-resolvase